MISDRMDMNEWLRKQLEAAEPNLLRETVGAAAPLRCSVNSPQTLPQRDLPDRSSIRSASVSRSSANRDP